MSGAGGGGGYASSSKYAPPPPPKKEEMTLRAVYTVDSEFVPLKFIESINENYKEPEEVTLEKLKDDHKVRIRTLSGNEYVVSMRVMLDMLEKKDKAQNIDTPARMWEIVFESWMNNIKDCK